ncbi:hypothetical protein Q0590_17600 [Rhodocytophaga aerolata]|uniref:Uncharacterized protein n=1 Tax=Rhodocytophaga aerolata TaxID=455078 RepID=A0ABT8RA57_9BACT|nr:hypothetical protein [Rhodocytophaga aerolata]MDO1448093.1 hypothetical protein [Rhodocytophaga aerolata]
MPIQHNESEIFSSKTPVTANHPSYLQRVDLFSLALFGCCTTVEKEYMIEIIKRALDRQKNDK